MSRFQAERPMPRAAAVRLCAEIRGYSRSSRGLATVYGAWCGGSRPRGTRTERVSAVVWPTVGAAR